MALGVLCNIGNLLYYRVVYQFVHLVNVGYIAMLYNTVKIIAPKQDIASFYDRLCYLLTDYENGELNETDLYNFLVEIENKIEGMTWDFEEI